MNNDKKVRTKYIQEIVKMFFLIFLIYIEVKLVIFKYCADLYLLRYINFVIFFLQLALVIHIIYSFRSSSYKLLWTVLVMLFPIPALVLYIILGDPYISKDFNDNTNKESSESEKYITYNEEIFEEIDQSDKLRYNQMNYLLNTVKLPIYRNTGIKYLKIGEDYFQSLIDDISNAKCYILIEFFTIVEGSMWQKLYETLKQKVSEGVKTYLITDGMGNSEKLPVDFKMKLESAGIEYKIFNSDFLAINRYLNYRDHRKIVVIDGKISYTGGINIGDEYINEYKKYGHWKDSGIKLEGKVTLSYIIMFIRMWNLCDQKEKLKYKDFIKNEFKDEKESNGYIMPYCDGPENINNPAQNLYIQILNSAKNYVYITSPYLVLDSDLVTAFVNCAKSGVDVRIILPSIPDKKIVQIVSRSFYKTLLDAGVKIYEYTPGFIHSKLFISDDELATVGSVNLDFRGLNFHYECGNWIYKTGEELKIKEDFLNVEKVCTEIKTEEWNKRSELKELLDKFGMTIAALF